MSVCKGDDAFFPILYKHAHDWYKEILAQDSKKEFWLPCFILNVRCILRQKQHQTGGRKGEI